MTLFMAFGKETIYFCRVTRILIFINLSRLLDPVRAGTHLNLPSLQRPGGPYNRDFDYNNESMSSSQKNCHFTVTEKIM